MSERLKNDIKNRRLIKWLDEKHKKNKIPANIEMLYLYALKYNKIRGDDTSYKLECRESTLSPGHYIVDIYEQFSRSDGELREFIRETVVLKPADENRVRF